MNPGLIVEGSWGMGTAVFDAADQPAWALSLTGIESRFSAGRQPERAGCCCTTPTSCPRNCAAHRRCLGAKPACPEMRGCRGSGSTRTRFQHLAGSLNAIPPCLNTPRQGPRPLMGHGGAGRSQPVQCTSTHVTRRRTTTITVISRSMRLEAPWR
nr:hypothetical protein [Arthrobacter sp. AQ5-05]